MNQIPLPVTDENTKYFITDRGYHWSRDGQYLTKDGAVIHIVDGRYEYSKIDEYGRRTSVKTITEEVQEDVQARPA
jgi:hypothetical protein